MTNYQKTEYNKYNFLYHNGKILISSYKDRLRYFAVMVSELFAIS